ncbi:MAG: NAD(P)-binding domain-containing protein [Mycobacterium leprae]
MNVGFIGMGSMGQMLVTVLARSKVLAPGELFASSRNQEKLRRLALALPAVKALPRNSDLVRRCDVVFLCVKPGDLKTVLAEIGSYITPDHLLVTITNAIDIATLEDAVPARVAKVIPSVVNAIGDGVSLIMPGSRCTGADSSFLLHLLGAVSHPLVITEAQARVASDLTSCGPAFLSYVFRALAQAARRYQEDLPAEAIEIMVRRTAIATCRLVEETGLTFDDIIAKVSTPGGITAEGINVMDELLSGVWEQVIETTIRREEAKKAKIEL